MTTNQILPALHPEPVVTHKLASAFLIADRIVYTSAGEPMGTYEYQRWAEPPSEMISDVLLRELQASGRYQHVYFLRSDARGDYLLRGRLYDLREIGSKVPTARVAFEFELRDSKTGTAVWSRTYSHDETVNGKDVKAVVAAMAAMSTAA